MKVTPTEPPEADIRFMLHVLSKGGIKSLKADPRKKELIAASSAFVKEGGSWKAIFKGSAEEIEKLRELLIKRIQDGKITKRDW